MAHRVTFIPGDGTGPEISEAVQRVLEATGVDFEWDFQDAGADVYEEEGTPLPDRVLDSIKERGLAIKGPITTPVGSGFRSINVALRKELDLYACLRPCKAYEGVRTRLGWISLRKAIIRLASSLPCSNSMPAYRSSWFSRTMTRSMSL